MLRLFVWQVSKEEIWKEAVHAAAAIHDQVSLLALWQWPALNQHNWNAPNGAAQVMSAHVLAACRPKQGTLVGILHSLNICKAAVRKVL